MEKRIDWIDFAKGFTIIFVILHHVLFPINFGMTSYIFSHVVDKMLGMVVAMFIMPVFFAISGYLYKDVTTLKGYFFMFYKKFIAFFIPYFIFNIIFLMENNNLTTDQVIQTLYIPEVHTWFLYSLFLMFLIWGAMDLLKLNIFHKFLVSIFLFMISDFIAITPLGLLPGPELRLTFVFMPYFLLGNILRNHININEFFSNKYAMIVLTIVVLAVFEKIYHFDTINTNLVGAPTLVQRIFLIIVLFKIFEIFPKNKFYNLIEHTGKYSIIIYLVHYFFAGLVCTKIIEAMGTTNDFTASVAIISSFVVAYGISLIVAWLCKFKIFSWIFFPRRVIDPLVKKTRFGKWLFSES